MKRVNAKVTFLTTKDGGRSEAIPVMNYGCPIFFEGIPALSDGAYDSRLLVTEHGKPIFPGDIVEDIDMIFLSPDKVIPYLRKGVHFSLWEGKIIAHGEINFIE